MLIFFLNEFVVSLNLNIYIFLDSKNNGYSIFLVLLLLFISFILFIYYFFIKFIYIFYYIILYHLIKKNKFTIYSIDIKKLYKLTYYKNYKYSKFSFVILPFIRRYINYKNYLYFFIKKVFNLINKILSKLKFINSLSLFTISLPLFFFWH